MPRTPGPWAINRMKSPVYGTNGQLIAETYGIGNGSRFIGTAYRDDDATLIAAAPELLETLKALVLSDDGNLPGDLMDIAQRTISKAEGKG